MRRVIKDVAAEALHQEVGKDRYKKRTKSNHAVLTNRQRLA